MDLISTNKTTKLPFFVDVSVACAIGPSVSLIHNREIQHVNIVMFYNVRIDFLNSQIWKEIMLELNGKPSSVTMYSIDLSFQNLVFWNLFDILAKRIT
jgi:hypothetical protein